MFKASLLELILLLYLGLGLAAISYLAWYYDRRDAKEQLRRNQESVFHCVQCHNLYSVSTQESRSLCPKCKFKNPRLQF